MQLQSHIHTTQTKTGNSASCRKAMRNAKLNVIRTNAEKPKTSWLESFAHSSEYDYIITAYVY